MFVSGLDDPGLHAAGETEPVEQLCPTRQGVHSDASHRLVVLPKLPASHGSGADDPALLWACRMGTDTAGLLKAARAAHGIPVQRVTPRVAELIDHDEFHRLSVSRRLPASATRGSFFR